MVRVRAGGGCYHATLIDIGKESMKLHFIRFCPEFNYMLLLLGSYSLVIILYYKTST